ncbi:MAG: response regulator [Labilithrix sp.]
MTPQKRVLYVEDNPDHADLVLRGFEVHGLRTIDHVEDGAAALDYLMRDDIPRPSLILLDLRLPKVDGLDVLQSVKSTPGLSSIPVVILTTSSNEGDIARAYANKANSYLVKPTDFSALDALLKDLKSYWLAWNVLPRGAF